MPNHGTFVTGFGHEITHVPATRGKNHDGVDKLIGVVNGEDHGSMRRDVGITNDFDFTEKDTENGMEKDFDGKVENLLELCKEDVNHQGNGDKG